jgi:hypothetical protein
MPYHFTRGFLWFYDKSKYINSLVNILFVHCPINNNLYPSENSKNVRNQRKPFSSLPSDILKYVITIFHTCVYLLDNLHQMSMEEILPVLMTDSRRKLEYIIINYNTLSNLQFVIAAVRRTRYNIM